MIQPTQFVVRAWAAWTTNCDHDDVKGLPSLLRRRVTSLGRRALGLASSLPDAGKARYVFSSRHGEFARTVSILSAIAEAEPLSPADFSLSVHHALISLLAITQGNHGGHTAVAGGEESFCCGLIEAVACLAEAPDQPVLLLYCDEPLPQPYDTFNMPDDEPLVLALLLGGEGGDIFTMQSFEGEGRAGEKVSLVSDFVQFLSGTDREVNAYSEMRRWRWGRHGVA